MIDDCTQPAKHGLLDLDPDCLRRILRLLTVRDACSLASTCSSLANVVAQDDTAWRHFAGILVGTQYAQSTPEDARDQLQLGSYTSLCQVVHQMGDWPVGLWRRVDVGSEPYGEVVRVTAAGPALVAQVLQPTGYVADDLFTIRAAASASLPSLTLVQAADYAGRPAKLTVYGRHMTVTCDALPPTFHKAQDHAQYRPHEAAGGAVAVAGGQGVPDGLGHGGVNVLRSLLTTSSPMIPGFPQGHQGYRRTVCLRTVPRVGVGPLVWDHVRQKWRRMFRPLPAEHQTLEFERLPDQKVAMDGVMLMPLQLTPSGGFDGTSALSRLEGLWSACYGPHGLEILHVQMCDPADNEDSPPGSGCRLVATKVTGDCNVPAGKITLCTLNCSPRVGRYSGFEEDDEGLQLSDRPIVALQEEGMSFVSMTDREVAARYRAVGQMNYVPGEWDPCWSRGQLLVYDDGLPSFSMLFEDAGEHFRHMIDYHPWVAQS